MDRITEILPTLIAGLGVLAAVAFALFLLVRNRKKGKHLSCGGDCSACMMRQQCESKKKEQKNG